MRCEKRFRGRDGLQKFTEMEREGRRQTGRRRNGRKTVEDREIR